MVPAFENEPLGKVLFVDDEINILKSLQRRFFQADFEVYTALSAKEGLEILEKENIDIVITDYRMPQIDGFQFLKMVKEQYPSVSRVVLSGFVEYTAVVKALTKGLTSTYFAKPWEDTVLEERIKHILEVRKILRHNKLLDLVNSIEKLPTLPSLYQEFMEAVDRDKSLKEISEIIQKDASVAAKVLQVANSAFYGLKGTTIEQAVLYLGLTALKDIVLTISLTDKLQWNEVQTRYLHEIFHHSSLVNCYIPRFYKLCSTTQRIEPIPSVGLIHDIGKIILLHYNPQRYESIVANQRKTPGMSFYESELELGFQGNTHAEIGAYFLDWWNLPEIIVEVTLFHHTPEKAASPYKELLEIACFTDQLLNYLWPRRGRKDFELPYFHCGCLSQEKIKEITSAMMRELNEPDNFCG